MEKLSNPKHCYACGHERFRPELAYDIRTLKTYCIDYLACLDPEHPNAPRKSKSRGADMKLIPVVEKDEMLKTFAAQYETDVMLGLEKILGQSVAARPTPPQALHIAKVAQENNLTSVNATISHILEQHMRDHSLDIRPLNKINWKITRSSKLFEPAKKREEEKTETKTEQEPSKGRFVL